jgi:hypothetical protein
MASFPQAPNPMVTQLAPAPPQPAPDAASSFVSSPIPVLSPPPTPGSSSARRPRRLYSDSKAFAVAKYEEAIAAAAQLSPTKPSTLDELNAELGDAIQLLRVDDVAGVDNSETLRRMGAEQCVLSNSRISQLTCAYNTGILLIHLQKTNPSLQTLDALTAALDQDGFRRRSICSYTQFARAVEQLKCHKLLHCTHGLTWGLVSRHVTEFFEVVRKYPPELFQLSQ